MTEEVKAVKRGAKLLDQLVPNWYRKVSKQTLKLSDPDQCVLGQVWGEYFRGLTAMAETAIRKTVDNSPLKHIQTESGMLADDLVNSAPEIDGVFYGFNTSEVHVTAVNESFERLGQQWLREISARRGARKAA